MVGMDNFRFPRSASTPFARRVVASLLACPAAVTLLAISEEHPPLRWLPFCLCSPCHREGLAARVPGSWHHCCLFSL